ncbi:MAG: glycosyltransferase [Thiolinea sp.]
MTSKPSGEVDASPRIAYVITSLAMGGAQRVLLQLLESELGRRYPACVIVLTEVPGLEERFAALGVPIWQLALNRPWRTPAALWRIAGFCRRTQPALVYSLMPHANLLAALAQPLAALSGWRFQLIWSMHNTPERQLYRRWDHRLLMRLMARLAKRPARIIMVAARSRRRYLEQGYPLSRCTLIPNGVTADIPERELATRVGADRCSVRAELGLDKEAILIGSLSRYVPEKDIPCLLQAFARLQAQQPAVWLLLAGEGLEDNNAGLLAQLEEYGVAERTLLLGVRQDAARLMRALDVATLASRSEAFPLFIAEAMLNRVPCAATDAGDIELLLGGLGQVTPVGDAVALAESWQALLDLPGVERWKQVQAARQRVLRYFSTQRMVERHAAVYAELLQRARQD